MKKYGKKDLTKTVKNNLCCAIKAFVKVCELFTCSPATFTDHSCQVSLLLSSPSRHLLVSQNRHCLQELARKHYRVAVRDVLIPQEDQGTHQGGGRGAEGSGSLVETTTFMQKPHTPTSLPKHKAMLEAAWMTTNYTKGSLEWHRWCCGQWDKEQVHRHLCLKVSWTQLPRKRCGGQKASAAPDGCRRRWQGARGPMPGCWVPSPAPARTSPAAEG